MGTGDDGRVLLHCHAGCTAEAICSCLGMSVSDLFLGGSRATVQGEGDSIENPGTSRLQGPAQGSDNSATPDATLETYAAAKALPVEFLGRLGLRTQPYLGGTAVRIPYLDEGGEEVAIRYRLRLEGDERFRWRTGSKPTLYGLQRLPNAQALESVVLVEGESDAQTLWLHGIPALGIPGATNWRREWAGALGGLGTVFVVREPDNGGASLLRSLLATPDLRDRLRIVDLAPPHKDASALHLADPDDFERAFGAALDASTVGAEEERAAEESEREELARVSWERCADLARQPDILELVAQELLGRGLVGNLRLAKLVYLAATSRLLPRPVSLVAKGPSAAGKSFETERTLRLFPLEATYALTAMSEHALAYSQESLEHRMIVVYEAAGVESDFASYLLRSLLSEGCIRYETVEKTKDGLQARLIERPGPTGAILTTTRIALHPENETRLLSVPVDDSPAQTQAVLAALAQDDEGREHDDEPWHALQEWLATGDARVTAPFARVLAECIPPVAVRLRRDFGLLLALVRTHALLHRASRELDEAGRVVADLADYAVVHDLVADLLGEGVAATVSASVRETVSAVESALAKAEGDPPAVPSVAVARELGLDPSAASRRVRAALSAGYLSNQETRRGRPARLVLGEPLPEDRPLLPTPEELGKRLQGDCEPLQGPVQPPTDQETPGTGVPLHDCSNAEWEVSTPHIPNEAELPFDPGNLDLPEEDPW